MASKGSATVRHNLPFAASLAGTSRGSRSGTYGDVKTREFAKLGKTRDADRRRRLRAQPGEKRSVKSLGMS